MRRLAIAGAMVGVLAPAAPASAFCGFYVNGAGGDMFNDATQVTLMRMGTRTVLSMQNTYKGPAEAFALVIPVPVVLREADVKTLPRDVFARIDTMGSPRLVEYWETDPCQHNDRYREGDRMMLAKSSAAPAGSAGADKDFGVTIEAQFTVGEYQIVILSAKDSTGLDGWLRAEQYQIPAGAEPLLRPYVTAGMKFFVAKVDPKKVAFEDGRAALSPLRFHYDSEDFTLPIRLGLANSGGKQDLIVNILAPNQRYEVGNYKNVTIPTNLDVRPDVRDKFGEFYVALYDRTIEKNPGAVVTEYAWQATTCDPCPGPQLTMGDLMTLGADVLAGEPGKPTPYQGWDIVHTRLHARYGTDITNDLTFATADPIVGGREHVVGAAGKLEEGARKDATNNFQGRYAIRHEWTGPIKCDAPVRGRWGGPPPGVARDPGVQPALDLAFAPRGQARLAELVRVDIPELGVKAASVAPLAPSSGAAAASGTPAGDKKSGCGCAGSAGAGGWAGLAVVVVVTRRRKRS